MIKATKDRYKPNSFAIVLNAEDHTDLKGNRMDNNAEKKREERATRKKTTWEI
jgi:hypothetical protein